MRSGWERLQWLLCTQAKRRPGTRLLKFGGAMTRGAGSHRLANRDERSGDSLFGGALLLLSRPLRGLQRPCATVTEPPPSQR